MSFGTLLICINFESLDLTIEANFSRDWLSGESEISQIISSQVKDPRYKFLNIVDVKCSSDLGVAKVFYTIINGEISDSPDKKSLEKFASMVRSKLSKFMQIRRVPKLIFVYDESLERYNNIDALLSSLRD